jgi:hypothetical protein
MLLEVELSLWRFLNLLRVVFTFPDWMRTTKGMPIRSMRIAAPRTTRGSAGEIRRDCKSWRSILKVEESLVSLGMSARFQNRESIDK